MKQKQEECYVVMSYIQNKVKSLFFFFFKGLCNALPTEAHFFSSQFLSICILFSTWLQDSRQGHLLPHQRGALFLNKWTAGCNFSTGHSSGKVGQLYRCDAPREKSILVSFFPFQASLGKTFRQKSCEPKSKRGRIKQTMDKRSQFVSFEKVTVGRCLATCSDKLTEWRLSPQISKTTMRAASTLLNYVFKRIIPRQPVEWGLKQWTTSVLEISSVAHRG